MSDELVVSIWCQLAFCPNLTEEQARLLEKCSQRILELL